MQNWLSLATKVIPHINHILPQSSGGNNDAVFVVTYDDSLPRICIQLAQPTQQWAEGLSLCLGRRDGASSQIGIWASIDYTYDPGSGPLFTANACVGVALDTNDLGTLLPFGEVTLFANQAIISSPINIQPCARLVYESGQPLAITVSSLVDNEQPSTDTDAFWANILPSNTWQEGQDWGTPNLSALIAGAADQALAFLSNWDKFQQFMDSSICGNSAPCVLKEVSKLGPWLHHFGVLDQHYNFMPIGDIQAIPTHFQNGNVVPHLLNCAANVLTDAVGLLKFIPCTALPIQTKWLKQRFT